MRIGINGLFWVPNAMGGTQTYILNLLKGLAKIDSDNDYVVYLNSDGARHFKIPSSRFQVQVCPIPGRLRLLRLLWENLVLRQYIQRHQLDLLHSLGYIAPFAIPTRSVVTVLDMIHYIYPSEIEVTKRLLWKVLFPLSLRRVDHIISISNSVKQDICRFFPWAEQKITPILLGVDHDLFNRETSNDVLTTKIGHKQRFILSVASLSPHKNIATLIRAFAKISKTMPDLQLILVGIKAYGVEILLRLTDNLSLREKVLFTGRVSNEELINYYKKAELFVFPSLYEGFGLPPLEAMACGCPVIASERSSIPEVVGKAALLFDPENVDQLADTIMKVLSEERIRSGLIPRGFEHAVKYTWEATASQTLEIYRTCY